MGLLHGRALKLGQALYIAAMITAFIVACSRLAISGGDHHGDKIAHVLAFYGLTLFGAVVYPRANLLILGLAMSAFGAMIEVVQGWSWIGRDADVWDWVADTAAVAGALIPIAVSSWRAPEDFRRAQGATGGDVR